MRGSRKFCQRRFNFDNSFAFVFVCFVFNLVNEVREDSNTTTKRPPVSMAGR